MTCDFDPFESPILKRMRQWKERALIVTKARYEAEMLQHTLGREALDVAEQYKKFCKEVREVK